jgi:ribulose-5-phosphate 4-epimerase/fuculose-1-phosphate aldolase
VTIEEIAHAAARSDLVAAAARLAEAGMSPGSSGNISVREGDRIIMSPTGCDLSRLDAERLSVLDFDGNLLDGPKPSKEYPFHRAFYRRDSSFRAVVHLHSRSATAYSCIDTPSASSAVPPVTPYFVMRVGQTPSIRYRDPGDPAQADDIEALPFPFRAALLQNHGLVTAGVDLSDAVETAFELEQTCAVLLALGVHPPRLLDDETVRRLADRYGTPWSDAEPGGDRTS